MVKIHGQFPAEDKPYRLTHCSGKVGSIILHLIRRRHVLGKAVNHVNAGGNFLNQMRPDSLIGPLVPTLDKFTPVLFHKPLDRRLVDEEDRRQLLKQSAVDIASLLEPNDLVRSADDTSVAQEPGDLSCASARRFAAAENDWTDWLP